ncbi:hypothetical protein lam_740 [Candidatus Liberibacter americanus str. Sao Paulo]|uniref:Uncharacterized protein n=1 Tax=Candidatus Liberibacter americanus str. Sao Paulo TaxID=1261131 RepID=U6B597_9HYPH|nr:hypothetical protein lam_740 [Candidatus Liberibacter americanus str. Sao Paulo]
MWIRACILNHDDSGLHYAYYCLSQCKVHLPPSVIKAQYKICKTIRDLIDMSIEDFEAYEKAKKISQYL